MIWRFRDREMTFERVRVMGILNVTPDSFSDGGEFLSPQKAVERALEMEREGADMIDIGAESTRPNAKAVSEAEELDRLLPVIREVHSRVHIPISVDTTKPSVAREVLREGAEIINNVDGLHAEGEMADVVREFQAGLILMHRRGTPQTMQDFTQYEDVAEEVFGELDQSLNEVVAAGVTPEQIVMDPGIGFSKRAEQNLELIARLERFQVWNRPILVGPSRKSFIGALIGKEPRERDWGTAAAVGLAVAYGANLVRIHEVSAMGDVVKVAEAIRENKNRKIVEK